MHKFVPKSHILEFPGQVDLSAYVNFLALAQSCAGIENLGDPVVISQGDFLTLMGIRQRCDVFSD